jgi:hypothetical protein
MTKVASKLLVAGLLAVLLAIRPAVAQPAGKILVCVAASDETPTLVLLRAEAISSRMFVTAGVAVAWHSKGTAACREAPQSGAVSLELVTNTPAAQHPDALAYAQPYQGFEIVVMLDRIERSVSRVSQVSGVLANVMTHEITHLLQGSARHSETGVMKAHWDRKEFAEMTYRPLTFAPEDIELIRLGLERRATGAAGAAPTPTTVAVH